MELFPAFRYRFIKNKQWKVKGRKMKAGQWNNIAKQKLIEWLLESQALSGAQFGAPVHLYDLSSVEPAQTCITQPAQKWYTARNV